jgi:transglutaminase-like putative cysteine protease
MKHFAPIFRWFAILTIAVGCSTYFASKDLVAQTAGQAETANDGDGATSTDKTEPDDSTEVVGVTFSDPVRSNYQVGFQALAVKKSATQVLITLPVPNDWPEQTVSVVDETIPTDMGSVKDRELNSGVKQLVVTVPRLRPGTEVRMLMTYQMKTSQINLPPDTTVFLRPRISHREGKPYTQSSPEITFRDSKLKKQVKELVTEKATPWEEVEAIYDWVRDEIDIRSGESRDTSKVFKDRYGCPEDVVGLFVAMCRANKIPARMVWVTGKQYAEFMLIDKNKKAHWFPAVLVGPREFGQLSEPLPILQKGDSIRVPEKKQRQKFVAEFATCKGTSKPIIKFVRQLQPVN